MRLFKIEDRCNKSVKKEIQYLSEEKLNLF